MAIEIEHKFLVVGSGWRTPTPGIRYRQGYVASSRSGVVRARAGGGKGFLTVKGTRSGHSRLEFEYEIPVGEADVIIDTLCHGRVVEKTRYLVAHGGFTWEVDEFHGANAGLVLAEIELEHEGQPFDLPQWIGADVSQDDRYTNSSLAIQPWRGWGTVT